MTTAALALAASPGVLLLSWTAASVVACVRLARSWARGQARRNRL